MSNTWGFGYDTKRPPKVKDHGHNDRLHAEKLQRKAERRQAHELAMSSGELNEHDARLHAEKLAREVKRREEGIARSAAHNKKLQDEAEVRKIELKLRREMTSRSFEWGGQRYPIDGKGPIKPIKN